MATAKRPALALNPAEKCHADKQSSQPSFCRGVPAEFSDWDGFLARPRPLRKVPSFTSVSPRTR